MRGPVTAPAPSAHPAVSGQAALDLLDARLDPTSGAPLAIGLSGGGDSLALLVLLARWNQGRRPILALCVDHGLHPQSSRWTRFAAEAAGRWGARFRTLAWEGPKPGANIMAAARLARHRLLAAAARAAGARVLLLGHTLDDAVEGEIMREDGVRALGRLGVFTPSPVWPEGRGLFVLRPLLPMRRQDLRTVLAAVGQPHLEDPANENPSFARVRARLALAAGRRPWRACGPPEAIRAADQVLEAPGGCLWLPRHALAPDGGRLLGIATTSVSGREAPARGAALERLAEAAAEGRTGVCSLSGVRAIISERGLLLVREAGEYRRRQRPEVRLDAGAEAVFDGRFLLRARTRTMVAPLAGAAARLPDPERTALRALAAAARLAHPALYAPDAIRLPAPLGGGGATADCLIGPRFLAASGQVRSEREIFFKTMAQA